MNIEHYTNCDLLPMDIDNYAWLHERQIENDELSFSMDVGKWMVFCRKQNLNAIWELAKTLFREQQLDGVLSMKCSTNFDNSRSTNQNEGVVILYCNDSNNEPKIMEIGSNILSKLNYTEKRMVYYKTDNQTWEGTGATGVRRNHTYRLFNRLYNSNTPSILNFYAPV
jgi:hypothetical protein